MDGGEKGLSDGLFLGVDVGAVNARAAVVDRSGRVVFLATERISSGPVAAVGTLVEQVGAVLPLDAIRGAGVCGSGRQIYTGQVGWQVYSSPYAVLAGVLAGPDLSPTPALARRRGEEVGTLDRPNLTSAPSPFQREGSPAETGAPHTIVQIGGQSAFVIGLEGGLDKPWRVARSPLCAAGTGRFLEQQAQRLGIAIEEFGPLALEWTEAPPRIAARCSVFAKSDLIHLQQKGWPVSAMLAGLSDSVARMIRALRREPFAPPVYLVGGVAANSGVVRALAEAIGESVIVPPDFALREAIGAALLARGAASRPADLYPRSENAIAAYRVERKLTATTSTDGWRPADLSSIAAPVDVYLGVDVGSTSTKAAVIAPDGEVLAKSYHMTAGQPLEAIKRVMADLVPGVEGKVNLRGVGVTGSGRYLVGAFVGADVVRNEITAQTRAALSLDPTIDTVFELGGQDSKYVYLENGTALDYQMNKACAAGTGSFVDELAEQLGVPTRNGDFARLAFAADSQLDLGERCAAFMSQAVTSAQHAGESLETIVASLSTSLAKNYRSKVVETRRIGRRVFLTGAVFYNEAAVAAFKAEFPEQTFVVPTHKEVTGAIGAALLAMEAMAADVTPPTPLPPGGRGEATPSDSPFPAGEGGWGVRSAFRGFSAIANAEYKLTNFTCQHCENSCAISMMATSDGRRLFYGSRCDRYDAATDGSPDGKRGKRIETPFDERERLLFAGYHAPIPPSPRAVPGMNARGIDDGAMNGPTGRASAHAPTSGIHARDGNEDRDGIADGDGDTETGPQGRTRLTVGVPRALMAYDIAQLLTGFLSALGVGVKYSSPTNKRLIEMSVERAYTDSCFPIKLLHGHVAELIEAGADYVLIPNAIRMARMGGDEDQRYSCPLVQAAPYIVKSALDLGDRLLDPIVDLSLGDDLTVKSFAEVATRLGFTREQGQAAARAGLAAQRDFEARLRETGRKALAELESHPDKLGVVLLSRAYNAQDAGANLGMANELAKLGVVPIPLDYLPLDDVDIAAISDRPYWNYERKLLAAAKIVAERPQLFGLFLSNFGCGPNSIIQSIVEDIMGGKPLGQIEVDEHAAEAGYVTRLEALVDTIRGYHKAGLRNVGKSSDYVRRVPTAVKSGERVLVVRMAEHAQVLAAAMRRFGVHAEVTPASDERSLGLSRDVTSGKECLPFRDTLGVYLRMAADGAIPAGARAIMAGSYGPCRLGKYAQEQQKILDERGIDLRVLTTVSNNAYSDLGLGQPFELIAWQSVVATDLLEKLLWMTRPYERKPGEAERIFAHYLDGLSAAIEAKRPFDRLMREATAAFVEARDPGLPRRPLVGINGEIYLRANRFCNKDLVALCEANGLEAEVAPLGEWFRYTSLRNVEDARKNREYGRLLKGELRKLAMGYYDNKIAGWFKEAIHEVEPGPKELLAVSAKYLPSRNGSEAVLSLGSGALQLASDHYAGVISVMPHGCMPGGIVAAISERISAERGHKPWISLTYDGFADKVNPERVADLAEQVRHRGR